MDSFQENASAESSSSDSNPLMTPYKFDISANRMDNYHFETLDENFTTVLKKRGRLYLATKLRNISLSETNLRYFSRKLATHLNKGNAENWTPTSYTAQIIPITVEEDGSHALKVVIESQNRKNKKNKLVVFTAVFFSWPVDNSDAEAFDLPYLFCLGAQKLQSSVNNFFEACFGCKILPAAFSQREIRWLMILILHLMSEERASVRLMNVTYQMNSDATKVELTFSAAALKEIWTQIHDEDINEITYKEVCTLHSALEEHIQENLHLDLSYFQIKHFSVTDTVTIDVSGKLFMETGEVIDLVYRFLNAHFRCLGL